MSENFIAAKDLPVSDAESVDILCVDNGELKRKTGDSLGGGGYVLKCEVEDAIGFDEESMTFSFSTNYDKLLKTLERGGSAYVAFPMALMMPEMMEVIPYIFVNILSWAFIPAGTMGNETNMVSCYGMISLSGQSMAGTFNLVNGSYIPSY